MTHPQDTESSADLSALEKRKPDTTPTDFSSSKGNFRREQEVDHLPRNDTVFEYALVEPSRIPPQKLTKQQKINPLTASSVGNDRARDSRFVVNEPDSTT